MSGSLWSIPVMRPRIPKHIEVSPYLRMVDEQRIYSNHGPLVRSLEERLAGGLFVDPSRVVVCANATVGLTGLAFLSRGKVFDVPSFTFAATPQSIIQSGKALLLSDIDSDTWMLDRSKRSSRMPADASVVVLPFGSSDGVGSCNVQGYEILDAAASLGSLIGSHLKPPVTGGIVFSLHATKVLGIGEGGFVVFGDGNLAEEFRRWINFGFDSDRSSQILGTNAKMSEIQAAYGLAVLDHAEEELADWRRSNALAQNASDHLGIWPRPLSPGDISPYWIVEFATEVVKREAKWALREVGVETRDWWAAGCHKMPAFTPWSEGGDFSVTERVAARTLGLPMSRDLSASEVEYIVKALEPLVRDGGSGPEL